MKQKKVWVVGSYDFTLGFRLAGVKDVVEVRHGDIQTLEKKLDEVVERDDVGIIIVREDEFKQLPKRKRAVLENLTEPIIIPLSEKMEGSDVLRSKIIQAVGVDLLK